MPTREPKPRSSAPRLLGRSPIEFVPACSPKAREHLAFVPQQKRNGTKIVGTEARFTHHL
jgi:hypothetical protein